MQSLGSERTPKEGGRKLDGRSRITNGTTFLPNVDGRSTWARIARDTMQTLMVHLGGEDQASATKKLIARRVGCIEAELTFLEDKFARYHADGSEPTPTDLDLYGRMANTHRRLCESIGWERVARDITPTLRRYVEEVEEAEVAEESES